MLQSNTNSVPFSISCNKVSLNDTNLWHFRLGHPSYLKILEMKQVLPNISSSSLRTHCGTCHLAKQNKLPYNSNITFAPSPFNLLHIDVWGSFHVPTIEGYNFFLTIVDDCTRFTWVFLLKQKSMDRSI